MTSLREANIFTSKTWISNFRSKLSCTTGYNIHKQIICFASEENDILLRYRNDSGSDVLKLVSWFRNSSRIIHDICFDPTGCWLLVLCFDNTLHIVPALRLLDHNQIIENNFFNLDEITSYVIPFVGPHECPYPKTCPNKDANTHTQFASQRLAEFTLENTGQSDLKTSISKVEMAAPIAKAVESIPEVCLTNLNQKIKKRTKESLSDISSLRAKASGTDSSSSSNTSMTYDSFQSFLISPNCPYPISTVWWQTSDKRNRAIVGYSDGSICFVGLTPNCPLITNISIENGAAIKVFICQDSTNENVTLLINSSAKEQWKLLLEQKSIKYTFPSEFSSLSLCSGNGVKDDWQIVVPINSEQHTETKSDNELVTEISKEAVESSFSSEKKVTIVENDIISPTIKSGIFPAAKARLASLKDLGARKLNAIKTKLSDNNKNKFAECSSNDSCNSFTIMESPATSPEILTTKAGPFYSVQNLRNTFLLSALHHQLDMLSVHSMDINLNPLFFYKLPQHCEDILISSNILYAIQNISAEYNNENNPLQCPQTDELLEPQMNTKESCHVISVISSAMASVKNDENIGFNEQSLLGIFRFADEKIINIHRMGVFNTNIINNSPKENIPDSTDVNDLRSPNAYVRLHRNLESKDFCTAKDMESLQREFPKINFDPCLVVTNKNIYFIDLQNEPYLLFLNAALNNSWKVCEEFCNTFDLSFSQCIEFAGDHLLRKKKITQALFTYNVVRIPPIRTALKLAMYGENYTLMQLCGMALKCIYILNSNFPCHPYIKSLVHENHRRGVTEKTLVLFERAKNLANINTGSSCSDFSYKSNDAIGSVHVTSSSQFHLSNLLLITLSERAVKEKNYIPLWNFIATNKKFHTNMTSDVLCQSGLYEAALLLAKIRGAFFDVFIGFVSVASQEFGWYSELNILLYNLSNPIFKECLSYLRYISTDLFSILQNKYKNLNECVLERLERLLNPFSSVFRPIVSYPSLQQNEVKENDDDIFNYCKCLIETYLIICIHLCHLKNIKGNIENAFNTFRLCYEDNQFAMQSSNFNVLTAGTYLCACTINGSAYFWGKNDVPCVYSNNKSCDSPNLPYAVKRLELFEQLNLEVHAVKCGKQHTLVLTNNGLYAFGANSLGQLGVGKNLNVSLQPLLVEKLDCKSISILETGQYHNAVVAEGKLYMWGWGIFGQLGQGSTENMFVPTEVQFFTKKNIIKVSLGHGHSLVLCSGNNGKNNLYVFGSNHFGQLGIGQYLPNHSEKNYFLKSLVPIKIEFEQSNIRLIHTKFFTNLCVSSANEIFTWGTSPQALRLANQIKRRANAKQKVEDALKKEINRRVENDKSEVNVDSNKSFQRPNIPKSNSDTSFTNVEHEDTEKANANRRHSSPSNKLDMFSLDSVWLPIVSSAENSNPSNISDNANISSLNENADISVDIIDKCTNSKENTNLDSASEHFTPQKVDCSEVSGEILQISSGMFHFAIISSTSVLYTWGKNLEHQLGTEDKDKKTVLKPTAIESIENPKYVECGADFTLVMTTEGEVKAFGSNASGQCGRDCNLPPDKTKPGKIFCLPTTKRLMSFEGKCIEKPVTINLPKNKIENSNNIARYMKSVPKFQPKFLIESNFSKISKSEHSLLDEDQKAACNSQNINKIISNMDAMNFNEEDSICSSNLKSKCNSTVDNSPEVDINNMYDFWNNKSNEFLDPEQFTHYIHYCLFVFHGLYDMDYIYKFTENSTEFRIKILMLNLRFVEAFALCLVECPSAQNSIKIFEYFTKDPSIVPMKREDLKYFIHQLFLHFISKNFDLTYCEEFFLTNIDNYLIELSCILFFNNNNTEIEQCINRKYQNILDERGFNINDFNIDDTSDIFNKLSNKFKAIVCKKLLKACNI